jgi:hypothetical protein
VVGMIIFLTLFSILISGLVYLLRQIKEKKWIAEKPLLTHILVVILVLGFIGSPSIFLGGSRNITDCQRGVLKTYTAASDKISTYIQPGEQVFWIGSDTQATLISLMEEKDIKIYPQLLNAQYSFRYGGNSDELSRQGFWNEGLAQQWIDQADTLLLEDQAYSGWFKQISPLLSFDEFRLIAETSAIGCSPELKILIFQRNQ